MITEKNVPIQTSNCDLAYIEYIVHKYIPISWPFRSTVTNLSWRIYVVKKPVLFFRFW